MKYLALIIFSGLLITACRGSSEEKSEENKQEQVEEAYACPMDCENGKTYNAPGKCPVCEMDLEKK